MKGRWILVRIILATASLALASCSDWDYMFCNPFDPNAEYDTVYTDTVVDGHSVSGGEKWSGTISLRGSVYVPHHAACLVISPGAVVTVASGSSYEISVQAGGGFYAMGTASEPIVFKSDGSGTSDWGGINVDGAMQFEYCLVKNAANGLHSRVYDSLYKARIANSCFHDCSVGMLFDGDQSRVTLTKLSFDSCLTGLFAKSSAWSYCDFKNCTYAASVAGAGETLRFAYSNFAASTSYDVDSSYSGTSVALDYCYPVLPNIGSSVARSFANQQSAAIAGAGCGFVY